MTPRPYRAIDVHWPCTNAPIKRFTRHNRQIPGRPSLHPMHATDTRARTRARTHARTHARSTHGARAHRARPHGDRHQTDTPNTATAAARQRHTVGTPPVTHGQTELACMHAESTVSSTRALVSPSSVCLVRSAEELACDSILPGRDRLCGVPPPRPPRPSARRRRRRRAFSGLVSRLAATSSDLRP